MDEHDLFPEVPQDLSALTDDELNELHAQSVAAKDKIVADDQEFLGDRTAKQIIEAMQAGVDGILRLKAEQDSRVQAAAAFKTELETLAAKVTPAETLEAADPDPADPDPADPADPDPADPADPDPADPESELKAGDPEPEPVTASAEKPARVLRRMPAAGRHAALTASDRGGMDLRVIPGLPGYRGDEVVKDEWMLAEALCAALNRGVVEWPVSVVHGEIPAPPSWRRAAGNDLTTRENRDKIAAITAAVSEYGITDDEESLVASGGICAPVTPYYQLANVATVQRPVRDAMIGFIADRGGITFAPPPVLSDITTAVGIVTAADDRAGGTFGAKSCQTVICPDFQVVTVDSIYHCVQAGNLGARAYPEQIQQFSALVLAAHARLADANLLNAIVVGSTAVTADGQAADGNGAIATLLNDILVAGAGMRSRNRMMQGARLQAMLPAWTADLLVADLVSSQFQRFAYNQAGVEALLESFGIQASWYIDGPSTGTGQVFGAQSAGAIDAFPTDIQWGLWPAGSWLFLDSGVLELGIVRDSVLNATNSYQIFGESWEAAAGIGVESLWITSTACPSGVVSAPAAPAGC